MIDLLMDGLMFSLIYLSTLDTLAVDNANSEILAASGEW